jgi:electron transfer flavoprotein beta subunit
MKILVCIGHVPDTTTKVKFDSSMTAFDETGVQWVINPWDELALTRAIELKEQSGGKITQVTVVNVGKAATEPTIRKALAIGADDAIRVDADPSDSYVIAGQIAQAVKADNYDIIFCGIETSDFNGSAVGAMLSEFLGIPSVSAVSSFEIVNDEMILKRDIDGGKETLSVPTPVLVIVQKGICINPRIPAMRGIMMARTKPLKVLPAANIEPLVTMGTFELPPARTACKMVDAEDTDKLIELLRNEAKVL